MPDFSVIVPIYNGEKYIRKCVDSILSQTHKSFELILVDDGSTDDCGKICDEYAQKDNRVVVIHSVNQGVSAARNLGLSVARGEYVAFCDGDDYYKDSLLERTYLTAKDTGAEVVSYLLQRISDKSIDENLETSLDVFDLNNENRFDFLYKVVTWQTKGWQACRSIFKRDIIEKRKIIFCTTCGNFAEDLGFTLEYLLYTSRIVFLNEYLYLYYDVRQDSMMNKSKRVYKVNEVNELSYYLNPIMRRYISANEFAEIHHHIIQNQVVDMYSVKKMNDFREWHGLLKTISKLQYFQEQNNIFYKYKIKPQIKKSRSSFIKYFLSKRVILTRYLCDLNRIRLFNDILVNKLVSRIIKRKT